LSYKQIILYFNKKVKEKVAFWLPAFTAVSVAAVAFATVFYAWLLQ
jgi:hypothetical protein